MRIGLRVEADQFGFKIPKPNFHSIAIEVRRLENTYEHIRQQVATINRPRILCGSTNQYAKPALGFQLDVAVLRLRATRAHLVLKRLLKDGTSADPVKAAEQLQIIAAKLRQIGRSGGTKDDEAGHAKS